MLVTRKDSGLSAEIGNLVAATTVRVVADGAGPF